MQVLHARFDVYIGFALQTVEATQPPKPLTTPWSAIVKSADGKPAAAASLKAVAGEKTLPKASLAVACDSVDSKQLESDMPQMASHEHKEEASAAATSDREANGASTSDARKQSEVGNTSQGTEEVSDVSAAQSKPTVQVRAVCQQCWLRFCLRVPSASSLA